MFRIWIVSAWIRILRVVGTGARKRNADPFLGVKIALKLWKTEKYKFDNLKKLPDFNIFFLITKT
jgi:hypothetical protein